MVLKILLGLMPVFASSLYLDDTVPPGEGICCSSFASSGKKYNLKPGIRAKSNVANCRKDCVYEEDGVPDSTIECLDFSHGACMGRDYGACDPALVNLADYGPWNAQQGYWIGNFSLYGSDGLPFMSDSRNWNFPYDLYKGFVARNIDANYFIKRSVYLFKPQKSDKCHEDGARHFTGEAHTHGTCGVNGNSKVFGSVQTVQKCSYDPNIKNYNTIGDYESSAYTTSEPIGDSKSNMFLYQSWITKEKLNQYEAVTLGNPNGRCVNHTSGWDCGYEEDRVMQSELKQLSQDENGHWALTRTAQGFDSFSTDAGKKNNYATYYREEKVDEETFWAHFNTTVTAFNILEDDLCNWRPGLSFDIEERESEYKVGYEGCFEYIKEAFN